MKFVNPEFKIPRLSYTSLRIRAGMAAALVVGGTVSLLVGHVGVIVASAVLVGVATFIALK